MERLRETLQTLTPFDLSKGRIHFSEPIAQASGLNTLVIVRGTLPAGTYGEFPFRYNRYDLGALNVRDVEYRSEETVLALLAAINRQPIFTYNLQTALGITVKQGMLLPQDVVEQAIAVPEVGVPTLLTVRASTHSYMYIGDLKIRVTRT